MADYQHILLAVDFSDQDTYVARKAERLATFFNAKLSIIHVLDNIPMPDTAYGTVIPLATDSSYELLEIEKNKLICVLRECCRCIASCSHWRGRNTDAEKLSSAEVTISALLFKPLMDI